MCAHRSIIQSAPLIDEIEILDLTPTTCSGVIVMGSIKFALAATVDLSSRQERQCATSGMPVCGESDLARVQLKDSNCHISAKFSDIWRFQSDPEYKIHRSPSNSTDFTDKSTKFEFDQI
jgi:hypothetical protein